MIPYALEGIEPRRRPVVTSAILALQLAVFAWLDTGAGPPGDGVAALLLSPVVHRDAWHLLVDGALFWLPASFVESRWGRPWLVVLYLFGGLIGALGSALAVPPPAVGGVIGLVDAPPVPAAAPAAAAVVVGTFAILFAGARMKLGFLSWFGVTKFRAPAWLVAPIYAVAQLFALRTPGGSLVAVLLALGAGALLGWLARATGVDARLRGGGGEPVAVAAVEASVRAAVLEKGGTPADPIEVPSASVVETRARTLPCPACGESPMTLEHHRIETGGERLLREVHTRCRRCGTARVVWLAVKERDARPD